MERHYGDCAPVYAEVRAQAAEIRGDGEAAQHWEHIRDDLGKDKGDEHA